MNKDIFKVLWRSILISLVFYLPILIGCAKVKPYERETLGNPILQRVPDNVEQGLKSHNLPRREGSAGGNSGSGGGCGC